MSYGDLRMKMCLNIQNIKIKEITRLNSFVSTRDFLCLKNEKPFH